MPQVGHQAVADVDHRRGTTGCGRCRRGVGRLRAPLGVHEGPGGPEPTGEDRQAGGRPAQPSGHGDDIPRLRPRAQDRVGPEHLPDGDDGDHDGSLRTRSPPTKSPPPRLGLRTHARVEVGDPLDRQVRGQPEGDDQRRRARAHDRHVDQVLRRGLGPDVVTGGPVAAEVPTLDEHVGGGRPPGHR